MSFLLITSILGVTMAIIVFHYYSPGRKNEVEQAKYDMLSDDDDLVNQPTQQNQQAQTAQQEHKEQTVSSEHSGSNSNNDNATHDMPQENNVASNTEEQSKKENS